MCSSLGSVLHGTESHRQFPVSHRQEWIRGEPSHTHRHTHTHTHTLWSSIVVYHFVCVSVLHVVYSLLGRETLLCSPFVKFSNLSAFFNSLLVAASQLFIKLMHALRSIRRSIVVSEQHTRQVTDPLQCLCAVCFLASIQRSLRQQLWVSLINFVPCCVQLRNMIFLWRTRLFQLRATAYNVCLNIYSWKKITKFENSETLKTTISYKM